MTAKTAARYKHSAGSAWRRVEQEAIVLDLETSVYYSLNDVGAFIWEKLGAGATLAEVVDALCAEYDVPARDAEKDVEDLVGKLRAEKLLVEA